MIEFFKNDTSVKMDIDDLMTLINTDTFEVIVDMLLSIEAGFMDEEDFSLENFLRTLKFPKGKEDNDE